ncbi:ATP-dependent Clp protease adapter ClpS [Psychrosphaera ytuae]|uniref:ATP-dependent Clp protease adapter protein ClpS n=1 Tax=Psychrosphaera ytuae TaxID=2820710 RepID=A0A975DCN1_9GAMM|nr:ATP-dependent Clp protease adapter ClpS [Psychrosphaera ytuae]QTH64418.1 ATP-dependent Clp protease adapter ClpS [Psychrosphaera ytuae]
MPNLGENDHNTGLVKEAEKSKLKRPPMYKVVLNNDDYTPMDFVVEVLMKFFAMDLDRANHIMFRVHKEGKAVVATYSAEIAETKVAQVNQYSRANEHPLLCTMEQE